jgi:chemotaxis protein methyltransferase CheR
MSVRFRNREPGNSFRQPRPVQQSRKRARNAACASDEYFSKQDDGWKIRDEIRAMASFRILNLLQPFSFPAPFDMVFCRNVAIYFTEEHRAQLFRNIQKCMAKDGALIIGSTESLSGLCPDLESKRYLRSVYYQQRQSVQ